MRSLSLTNATNPVFRGIVNAKNEYSYPDGIETDVVIPMLAYRIRRRCSISVFVTIFAMYIFPRSGVEKNSRLFSSRNEMSISISAGTFSSTLHFPA